MSPEQLWQATLGELELELSKAKFVTWFEDTFIIDCLSGNFTIGVPNAFTKTWLENKYHAHILKALRRITDEEVHAVVYRVTQHPNSFLKTTPTTIDSTTLVAEEKNSVKSQKTTIKEIKQEQQAQTSQTQSTSTTTYPKPGFEETGIQSNFTFENFIVGKKNELAYAACGAVAERPGVVYNPLFIYGGVGLGKTHLMQAVGNTLLQNNPRRKVLYVSCETFTNEFIRMVGEGKADKFKDKYRSVDLLMVDDIQFLAGKEGTQEAFFHTFNHLHERNRQILLTSDRPPRAIPTLEQRLVSRFEGGMLVDVHTPDFETRVAILKQKCEVKNITLSDEVAQFIATHIQHNIRELEGALNRVIAAHKLENTTPTLESVRQLLASYTQGVLQRAITSKKIISGVAQYFDISEQDLIGNGRKHELVLPRQIIMYLMREEMNASYPNIGQELGGRDHSTAMHSYQKILKYIETDERVQTDINTIKQRLYNS